MSQPHWYELGVLHRVVGKCHSLRWSMWNETYSSVSFKIKWWSWKDQVLSWNPSPFIWICIWCWIDQVFFWNWFFCIGYFSWWDLVLYQLHISLWNIRKVKPTWFEVWSVASHGPPCLLNHCLVTSAIPMYSCNEAFSPFIYWFS